MNIANHKRLLIQSVKINRDDRTLSVYLNSGDVLVLPYDYTDRIASATVEKLQRYHLIGEGIGIHFDEIDEDISLEGILRYKQAHDFRMVS